MSSPDPTSFSPEALDLAPAITVAEGHRSASVSAIWWVFASTLFMSAALLFLLEPMFAKMVLPYLGGSPEVWNTCVVFFQATMLAGYVYAHVLSRSLPVRRQVVLHVFLLVAVSVMLPVVIPSDWAPPVDHTPVLALLRLLLITAGPPFFVVSATAPLIQQWFSQTNDDSASDPYVLYSASNLGSVTALLAYPLVVERSWRISTQATIWEAGYGAFALGMLLCGLVAAGFRNSRSSAAVATSAEPVDVASPDWRRKLRWLLLSLVPSSLMLAVTAFLSTDIAAVPLLWVVPLTLYLLSFVNAFSRRPLISIVAANKAARIVMMPLALALILGVSRPTVPLMALHILAFFACALLLHGQLARARPDARHLTTFYVWVSIGGVLGGAFNTLIAPVVFTGITEYPLMLVAVCALGLTGNQSWRVGFLDVVIPLLFAGLVALLMVVWGKLGLYTLALGIGISGALYLACAKHPVRLATGIALMFIAGSLWGPSRAGVLLAERTFFGVLRVRADSTGKYHQLVHGTTLHGEQALDPAQSSEPRTYYHRAGPIGQVIEILSPHLSGGSIGVVGLGVGSLAAYSQPGQTWTFYEIDPAIEHIARAPQYFRYMSNCGARCTVTLGDARLSLAKASAHHDLLIVDAFSSDAIPMHLLTREALQVYLRSLKPEGVLAFHISNWNVNLKPVLGALAKDSALTALARLDLDADAASGHGRSEWLVMARASSVPRSLLEDKRWQQPPSDGVVWTDDYSNLVTVLMNSSRF
jgi:SAM-dependent methyltransferase